MAKKKKQSARTAPKPQANSEKQQKRENPAVREEKIIDQLFGSLEQEPDIERDIVNLGVTEQEEQPEKPPRSRFFFGFAVFTIIMAIIGCVAAVRFAVDMTGRLMDNTSLKNELAQFIFPVVINDIAPFEAADEIPDSSKISCAIWNILLNGDTKEFENEGGIGLTIPEYNVNASCRELFGAAVSLEHKTVGTAEVRFVYDEEKHSYNVTKNIRYLTYSPKIIEIKQDGEQMTLTVGYLPPTISAVAGMEGLQVHPEKYMDYTINRLDGKKVLVSVRFSDYEAQTDEVRLQ